VPDYKDKQLITPSECQPVDADGVGKCPDPECCKNMTGSACNIMAGSICFSSNSARLNNDAQNQLSTLAAQMKASPTCKVVVMGNAGNSKLQQQRSWDRVNSVIEYLSETQQISRDQFIFQYQGGTGDVNCIMYRSALPGEEGPSNVAPPHPQLGTKK
ncbi:MAG TPA: OmpA family protein, partial [Arachidicoccus sp.]|nr:OmpA family protein [Arachidicoccus sp.]